MKTISVLLKSILVISTLVFAGCNDVTVSTGDGSEEIKASGVKMTEVREIPTFNQISLEGVFNVYLLQKDKESVRIEADENVLPLIVTEVVDGILTVKLKEDTKIVKMKLINVYITLKDIQKLETKGVGMVQCMEKLNLKTVELSLKGVGATKLNLDCETLTIQSELVGSLGLQGSGKSLTIKHKGIGSLEAFDFKAEKVNLESDGVGKAEVFASEELIVDAKGLGGVEYKGNPSKKNIKKEGLGEVESAD